MEGKVIMINRSDNLIAVLTEEDEFTIFEILDIFCNINLGDIVRGDLETLGRLTLYNESRQEDFEVYIEDIHGSENTARRLLNLKT